ncbi:MAG: hypothetical protein Q4C50_00705 [Eubacteriales bacterium]|nr:hypothetical protein [Eubacteriales bacterium]
MLNFAVLKQDYIISRRTLLVCGVLQILSLILAAVIRNLRLIQIADVFFDTLPVVVIPMIMQIVLVYEVVRRQDMDTTMQLILSTGISPSQVITTKIIFLLLNNLLLFTCSMLFGCVAHVYDLTGVWHQDTYIILNLGGMCLQVFTGGWCFLAACVKKPPKSHFYEAAAGILLVLYLVYLAYYLVPGLFFLKYFTVFSLFSQEMFAKGSLGAFVTSLIFAVLGAVCFLAGKYLFCSRGGAL